MGGGGGRADDILQGGSPEGKDVEAEAEGSVLHTCLEYMLRILYRQVDGRRKPRCAGEGGMGDCAKY